VKQRGRDPAAADQRDCTCRNWPLSAWFGTKRPPVQIRPPRPGKCRSQHISAASTRGSLLVMSESGSQMGADLGSRGPSPLSNTRSRCQHFGLSPDCAGSPLWSPLGLPNCPTRDQAAPLRGAGSGAPRAGLWPWEAPPGAPAPSQPLAAADLTGSTVMPAVPLSPGGYEPSTADDGLQSVVRRNRRAPRKTALAPSPRRRTSGRWRQNPTPDRRARPEHSALPAGAS